MATKMLYASVFLSLLTVAATNRTAQQVVHQKLEDALLGNCQALYLMQKVFFPLQWFPPTSVVIRVCLTVGGAMPGHCDKHSYLQLKLRSYTMASDNLPDKTPLHPEIISCMLTLIRMYFRR